MQTEPLFPLTKAIRIATSQSVHLSTALRWCQKPNRFGIRLESKVLNGRRLTSVEAVLRYVDACTAAADGQPKPSTSAQIERGHEAAMKELDDLGV